MGQLVDIEKAFGSVPGLFVVLANDATFTIVAASEDYLKATHTTRAIIGRSLFEVFPDNPAYPEVTSVAQLTATFQQVVSSRQRQLVPVQRYDIVVLGEGGGFQERHWAAESSPVLGEDGRVQYIIHRVDELAAKSDRRAIAILDKLVEGFLTLDRQWRYDYVNREAHRILGVEPGTLTGRVIWEAYPGLLGTEFDREFHRVMHRRQGSSFTAFFQGMERWYEVKASPAPEGISVYFRDVTEERSLQAERESLIAESERQQRIYETALDATPDFVYVFDTEHRLIYANAAMLTTWGIQEAQGKRWTDLGYPLWQAEVHDAELDRVIRSKAQVRGEFAYSGPTGRRVYDYIFAPVVAADGGVVAVAGTARDITERKATEQAAREQADRLAEADRTKDEFLATLSHELRNPLAPLRTSIDVLRRPDLEADAVRRVHAVMERQIIQLIRLVDDLLEVSRITRGEFPLRKELVDLSDIVQNATEAAGAALRNARQTLQVVVPVTPVRLVVDPVRLTQVVVNLLNNAATYSDGPGEVRLSVRCTEDEVLISVRDQGMGIAPEVLPKLFAMFSRGHLSSLKGSKDEVRRVGVERRASTRRQAGLGIGLALSRRLAQMHGGSLDAYSAGLGQGSEFTVRLPWVQALPSVPVPARAVDSPLGHLRVLVTDDNEDAADALAMALELLDLEVTVAHNGPDALSRYREKRHDVVLLDIGMPGMSGYDVARRLRDDFPHDAPMLIAVTGWGQPEDRDRAHAAGFHHHLVKPAEFEEIRRLLAGVAGRAERRPS